MPNPMTRLNAALEGAYLIEGELGEGGMATVNLAYDLKHERKVALKLLKPELAAVIGAERFLAEIKRKHSNTPTGRASSTGTSSRPTSCFRPANQSWRTSGSPSRSVLLGEAD